MSSHCIFFRNVITELLSNMLSHAVNRYATIPEALLPDRKSGPTVSRASMMTQPPVKRAPKTASQVAIFRAQFTVN